MSRCTAAALTPMLAWADFTLAAVVPTVARS